MTSSTIRIDIGACNNHLPVVTTGGIELPPKVCCREKGHSGPHYDGKAAWLNKGALDQEIEKRFDRKRA